jgi:hypothetical protein
MTIVANNDPRILTVEVTEIGSDVKRAHLAVADDEQPRLLEPLAQTLQERDG